MPLVTFCNQKWAWSRWRRAAASSWSRRPDLIEAFAEYLNDRGFEALTVPGGYAYESLAAARPPDLVVLDLAMPGEKGRALLMRIRRAATSR